MVERVQPPKIQMKILVTSHIFYIFLLITHEGVWREKTERSTTKILDFAHGKCIAGGTGEPCFSPVKLQGLHSEECF